MGQKVNPVGLRIGVVKDWNARWFADKKNFSTFLVEDNKIRKAIKTKYYDDSISSIKIERKISSTNLAKSSEKRTFAAALINRRGILDHPL